MALMGGMGAPPYAGGIEPQMPPLIQQQEPVSPLAGGMSQAVDATAGIKSIAENIAAGFSKDPARRAQYQQQLQQEDAQRQMELQQLREHQLHYMDTMVQLAANGGLTPAIRQHIQQSSKSIDQLFGPGTAANYAQLAEMADASFKAQPKNNDLVTAIDPKTGRPTYVPKENAAGMQASTDVLSPEALAQKEQLAAAGKTSISIDARPVSDTQSKALGYADRMSAANDVIEGLNYQPSTIGNAVSSIPVIGNALTSEQHQQFNQAKLDFMSADLRKESGAVISPEEYASEDTKFFPQPNDKPETIKQKAEARKRVILNTYREGRNVSGTEAGKTASQGAAKSSAGSSQDHPVGATSPEEAAKLPSGTWFTTTDGRVVQRK